MKFLFIMFLVLGVSTSAFADGGDQICFRAVKSFETTRLADGTKSNVVVFQFSDRGDAVKRLVDTPRWVLKLLKEAAVTQSPVCTTIFWVGSGQAMITYARYN